MSFGGSRIAFRAKVLQSAFSTLIFTENPEAETRNRTEVNGSAIHCVAFPPPQHSLTVLSVNFSPNIP